ncbi:Serine/threonine protein kinase PrkC, regulator of stationary phase [Candidatus Sumerlaea chitinivorans]|uniref:non-specific serine/threonine protein kinase n=1 Tax=Sumerlaea chitinivorans TaxID=2250252 RepID=A0A2Z4Y944_SUMC1|nr:Serine/threonine protein kinase PrkC, regulator of stationary phase [Candidatus Sumerlaea chitinivorans]
MSELIAGKYEILEVIGRGGMGTVYKARQHNLDRIVALKMLSEEMASDPEFRARFQQEAQVVARLNHPNIVAVYDIEPYQATFCIIMEFVDGKSLQKIIDEGGLPERDVLLIGAQIARALHYAHEQGVVHRDVKPDNILVTRENIAKITDFGIARFRESKLRTQTGISMGTPRFMSPEQVTGKNVDGQSDLYSLGVCLYYALTGKVPFDGENAIAIATRHIYESPVPPSQLNPSISAEAEKVVMRALEKTKAERFATGEEMAQALEQAAGAKRPIVVGGSSVTPVPDGATRRMPTQTTPSGVSPDTGWRTPTGLRKILQLGPESPAEATEGSPPTPPRLTTRITEAPIVTDAGRSAWDFVKRYWMGIGAVGLVLLAILYVVQAHRSADLLTTPSPQTGVREPRPGEIGKRFEELDGQVKALLAEGRALEARQLVTEFRTAHPQAETSAVETLLDRVNAALPLSEIEELTKRRDEKGKRYYRDPKTLALARAYLEAARELYAGMQKPYPGEGYLKLLDQNSGPNRIENDEQRANQAFARAKELVNFPERWEEAEQALVEAIGYAPDRYQYWLELAKLYRNNMFIDDARVLLRYIENHAPKNTREYQEASQLLRDLEKPVSGPRPTPSS